MGERQFFPALTFLTDLKGAQDGRVQQRGGGQRLHQHFSCR